MKNLGLILIQCLFIFQSFAQSRYLSEVFPDVKVSSDVVYGRNATIFTKPLLGHLTPVDLKMDVYEPIGDTLQERPLVLVIHDGNFFPQVLNGSIIGSKTDSSVVEICTQLAKRGFTAAAITYRQGWNPLGVSQLDRVTTMIQALYRGVQDGRTAIRFFRKNYNEEDNEFHIDPNRITVWGNGTGAFVALNMVAISHINDFALTTNGPGKFLFDSDNDGVPDTPMVLEEIHGDIEGKNLTIAPYDFLGITEGDTTNYANHLNYSSEFHLSVNISGSVADIGWMNDNSIPTISIQSIFDLYYPYNEFSFVVHPGTLYFQTQGSELIGELQENLGNNQAWKDGIKEDEIYTKEANWHSAIAGHPYYEGVYPVINSANSNGIHEGVVIDWWDPNSPSPIDGPGLGLPWNEVPSSSGLSMHDLELIRNENMSAEKARANIDTIMNYFAPRACITLELSDCHSDIFTSSAEEQLDDSSIKIFPNPSNGLLTINASEKTLELIQVFDLDGRLVKSLSQIHGTEKEIDLSDLVKGIYLIKIQLNDAIVVRKIMLN